MMQGKALDGFYTFRQLAATAVQSSPILMERIINNKNTAGCCQTTPHLIAGKYGIKRTEMHMTSG